MEKIIVKDSLKKGIISEVYRLLTSHSPENSQYKLNAWKEDLQSEVSERDWKVACANAHTMSINTHLKLIQYKWLMRTYVTQIDLNRYNKNVPDVCTKCLESRGTLFHCIWQCRKIKIFWEEVRAIVEKIISKQIVLDPKLFLLGLYPEKHNDSRSEQAFIDLSLLYDKKCVALLWKKIPRPSTTQWIRQMLANLLLDRLSYILKAKQHVFEDIWSPFISYIKDLDLTEKEEDS